MGQALGKLAPPCDRSRSERHPYLWLEEDSMQARTWVAVQHHHAQRHLARLPLTAAIQSRLGELMGHGSTDSKASAHFESILSPKGTWVAEGFAPQGSDQHCWRLRPITLPDGSPEASPDDSIEELTGVQPGSLTWAANSGASDSRMIFYDRPLPWLGGHGLYAHRLGTPQGDDQLLLYVPEQPSWHYQPQSTADGRYLVVSVLKGSLRQNALWLLDLAQPQQPPLQLVGGFDGSFEYIGNLGSRIWLWVEDAAAPLGCVMALDVANRERADWQTIIPAGSQPLQRVQWLGKWLLAYYLDRGASIIKRFDHQGRFLDVIAPHDLGYGLGTISSDAWLDDDENFCFEYTDLFTPAVAVRYAAPLRSTAPPLEQPRAGLWQSSRSVLPDHDTAAYVTSRHFATSGDGTPISLFLCRRKHTPDQPPDQPRPTLLAVYGGFNVAWTPYFDPATLLWLEMGGVFALANLRGGGEYGWLWHQAALGCNKQRTFDDALAVAGWLVAQGITTPSQLGLIGSSNGGLTVAACLTQAPEAMGAAVIEAGVLDMLRFPHMGIGSQWQCEYGRPDDPNEGAALRAYSPLHNITRGRRYPPTLLLVDRGDQRVGAAHSYKFAAALQAAQPETGLVLLHVSREQGHGERRLPAQQQTIDTLRLAFLAQTLGLKPTLSGATVAIASGDKRSKNE